MIHPTPTTEEKLLQALELYDQGISVPEVIKRFPEHTHEVAELLATVEQLTRAGETLSPSPELLTRILEGLPISVTTQTLNRYSNSGPAKGRAPFANLIVNLRHAMTNTWKVAIPVGIVAIVAVVAVTQFKPGTTPAPVTQTPAASLPQDSGTPSTPATGDFTEIQAELFAEADASLVAFNEEGSDSDLLALDSQELIDLEQSYDANSF